MVITTGKDTAAAPIVPVNPYVAVVPVNAPVSVVKWKKPEKLNGQDLMAAENVVLFDNSEPCSGFDRGKT